MASLVRRGLRRIRRMVWRTTAERSHARWLADRGTQGHLHRLDYPLGPDAIVVDVGGYDGRWAERVIGRFGCTVHVFEPVPEFAAAIEARLAGQPAIVHHYGLARTTRDVEFTVAADGSSALRLGSARRRVRLRAADEVFEECGLTRVDLMKINVEGGEYELLEHLLDRGLIPRIEYLQIQFHDFVPDAARRMRAIQSRLGATHVVEWQYVFVWESWRRRAPAGATA